MNIPIEISMISENIEVEASYSVFAMLVLRQHFFATKSDFPEEWQHLHQRLSQKFQSLIPSKENISQSLLFPIPNDLMHERSAESSLST